MSPTDIELQAKFADPKTYEGWTKEDWDEARETCLPEDAPTNKDGYSVPIEYFKYDIDWRRGVREFQEDLGEGRYEPEWQAQAHQAMDERARGDFDKFKEQEFEEFWGQKQRTPWTDLAGEAAQIKLQELAEQRYIREGDIFSYVRLIKSGNDKILVEKDARVAKIEGGALTMAIPPGRLKFARHLPTPKPTPAKGVEGSGTQDIESAEINSGHKADTKSAALQPNGNSTTHPEPETFMGQKPASTQYNDLDAVKKEQPDSVSGNEAVYGTGSEEVVNGDGEASKQNDPADSSAKTPHDGTEQTDTKDDIARSRPDGLTTAENGTSGSDGVPKDTSGGTAQNNGLEHSTLENVPSTHQSDGIPEHQTSPSADTKSQSKDIHSTTHNPPTNPSHPLEDVILHTTTSLTDLERRFVEIDGRLDPKDHRCANPWKMMRGKRNEQDLGTLFEMREEYYVSKSNRTVKMPKEQVDAAKGKGKVKTAGATGGVKSAQQRGAETKARKKAEAAAAAAASAAEGGTTPVKKTANTPKKTTEVAGKMGAKRTSPDADDDDDADSGSEELMGTPQVTKSGRQVKKRRM